MRAALLGIVHWALCTGAADSAGPPPKASVLIEAEDLLPIRGAWRALPWGTNYYAATLANTFLSRKAYLGAPARCAPSVAEGRIEIPRAGAYLVLARYEAPYRFEARFTVRIEQAGRVVFERGYGARSSEKIWAFGRGIRREVAWSWGAVENIVWEGHDAVARLAAGPARVLVAADRQPEPAARRDVDALLLTADRDDVRRRIEKEGYLPLDGLLTQAGDVFARVENPGPGALKVRITPSREHSPYWVHLRAWRPKTIGAAGDRDGPGIAPGGASPWVEIGSILDSLNDSTIRAEALAEGGVRWRITFALRTEAGSPDPIRRFDLAARAATFAVDADTRRSRRIRRIEEVLPALNEAIRRLPVRGRIPRRILFFAWTPEYARGTDAEGRWSWHAETPAGEAFVRLMGIDTLGAAPPGSAPPARRFEIDVRSIPTDRLEAWARHQAEVGNAARCAVVSLGDEIELPGPPRGEADRLFRAHLAARGLRPGDLLPAEALEGLDEKARWDRVRYRPEREAAARHPRLFYASMRFRHAWGIEALARRTAILRRHFPRAGIGANYSPHADGYLPTAAKWIRVFEEGAMTLPWSEDYLWQVPVASQQIVGILLDAFRRGLRGASDPRILFYVMPHFPGNTPRSFRRSFFCALAHGAKAFHFFELKPTPLAYTENYVAEAGVAMYQAVRQAVRDVGALEDVLEGARVRPARAALLASETADIWGAAHPTLRAAKRCLYIALKHRQLPLDIVTEDDLAGGSIAAYEVLYLADTHLRRDASRSLAAWVGRGGTLFVTAAGGLRDEGNRPNTVLRDLAGIRPAAIEHFEAIRFAKQDLSFAKPRDRVTFARDGRRYAIPVLGARQRLEVDGAEVLGRFADGSPAVSSRRVGSGRVIFAGFLPSLAYFHGAIPRRPADRGATDDAMSHFLPTDLDAGAAALIGLAAEGVERPVLCADPLVESSWIEGPRGIIIPLINYRPAPIPRLRVRIAGTPPARAESLCRGPLPAMPRVEGGVIYELPLDAADAIILRR